MPFQCSWFLFCLLTIPFRPFSSCYFRTDVPIDFNTDKFQSGQLTQPFRWREASASTTQVDISTCKASGLLVGTDVGCKR